MKFFRGGLDEGTLEGLIDADDLERCASPSVDGGAGQVDDQSSASHGSSGELEFVLQDGIGGVGADAEADGEFCFFSGDSKDGLKFGTVIALILSGVLNGIGDASEEAGSALRDSFDGVDGVFDESDDTIELFFPGFTKGLGELLRLVHLAKLEDGVDLTNAGGERLGADDCFDVVRGLKAVADLESVGVGERLDIIGGARHQGLGDV